MKYTLSSVNENLSYTTYYFSCSSDDVYYVTDTDPQTYRLEARRSTAEGGTTRIAKGRLTAKYYPTSYGSVSSIVTNPDNHPNAVPIHIEDEHDKAQTVYEVDLRELELKVKEAELREKEAHIERLEAERELERAKRDSE